MGKYHKRKSAAGKGDFPRSCFSPQFRSNYDSIDWSKKAAPVKTSALESLPYFHMSWVTKPAPTNQSASGKPVAAPASGRTEAPAGSN